MRSVAADGLDLLARDSYDVASWQRRIERDLRRAQVNQSVAERRATALLTARSMAAGAEAVALTGSTARRRRTATSDLDLHVVGARPEFGDVEVDVDLYATSADVLFTRLRDGDDYIQWTLRFGCILFDSGVLRAAATELVASARWPSAERKLGQVRRMRRIAEHVVVSGDSEAATGQVKSLLTGLARWRLLAAGVFPLSRAELASQLRVIGDQEIATALDRCIHGDPEIDELCAFTSLAGNAIARVDERIAAVTA
jgi:predicted nucleotidyltransferase